MTTQLAIAVNAAFDNFLACPEHEKDMVKRSIEAALLFYNFEPKVYDRIIAAHQDASLKTLQEILSMVEANVRPS